MTRSRDDWMEALIEHDVPAAPVLQVGEAMATPQAGHRRMTETVVLPRGEQACLVRSPVREAGSPPHLLCPAPRRGGQGRAILRELLGYTSGEVEALSKAGVIG